MSHKRHLANLRERRRMVLINQAFEILRNRLPINTFMGTHRKTDRIKSKINKRGRLTKVDILRSTITYIRHLISILQGNQSNQFFQRKNHLAAVKNCCRRNRMMDTSETKYTSSKSQVKLHDIKTYVYVKSRRRATISNENKQSTQLAHQIIPTETCHLKWTFGGREESRCYLLSCFNRKQLAKSRSLRLIRQTTLWVPKTG